VRLSLSVRVAESFSNKRVGAIPLQELAPLARNAGYEALCMRASVCGVQHDRDEVATVRAHATAHDLAISMVTADFDVPENKEAGPRSLRDITPSLDLAEALGSDLIRVCLKTEEDIKEAASAADEAAERGIRLAHQSHTRSLFETVEGSVETLKRIDRKNFGIIYEPANLAICGQTYGAETLRAFEPYLFNVYLQNHVPEDNGDLVMNTWTLGDVPSRHYPLDSGQGIDFDAVFGGLHDIGYDGWVTLHHAFAGQLPPDEAARASADFLKQFTSG
jgi:sugar phosphate isomerase/epimerase